jgi:sulfate transport system substrate-binding protein
VALAAASLPVAAKDITLLSVCYAPTRELYVDSNKAFATYWKTSGRPRPAMW